MHAMLIGPLTCDDEHDNESRLPLTPDFLNRVSQVRILPGALTKALVAAGQTALHGFRRQAPC